MSMDPNYQEMLFKQLITQVGGLSQDLKDSNKAMGSLQTQLTKTQNQLTRVETQVQDYSGLRGMVLKHEQVLTAMGAYSEGYEEAEQHGEEQHKAIEKAQFNRRRTVRDWLSLGVAAIALGFTVFAHYVK